MPEQEDIAAKGWYAPKDTTVRYDEGTGMYIIGDRLALTPAEYAAVEHAMPPAAASTEE